MVKTLIKPGGVIDCSIDKNYIVLIIDSSNCLIIQVGLDNEICRSKYIFLHVTVIFLSNTSKMLFVFW